MNETQEQKKADYEAAEPLTWDEIVEHCSRLHTTRQRPEGPWEGAAMREDSQVLHIIVEGGSTGRIVPTRMHEPGFYLSMDHLDGPSRTDMDMLVLRAMADSGQVRRGVE